MRRNLLLLLVSIVLVFSLTAASYAAVDGETAEPDIDVTGTVDISENENEIMPYYVAAGSASAGFSISSKGVASCLVQVTAKKSTAMNAAKATIQIKNSSGSVVKKWTKANLAKSGSTYRTTLKYTLSKKGSYYMTATIYCYKGQKLIETISKKTTTKKY